MAAGVALALSGRTSRSRQRPSTPLGEANRFRSRRATVAARQLLRLPNASLASGNFRLDRRRDSMPNRVGANGARIVPGNSEVSRLYQRVSGTQAGLQMPPTGALSPDAIRTINSIKKRRP